MTETKRDVVEAILLAKDTDTIWDSSTVRYYLNRYDAASPDDLPVIPKRIGNFIKQSVYEDATLQEALECAHEFRVGSWVSAHSEIFARAWVLEAWKVEETGEIVKLEADHG